MKRLRIAVVALVALVAVGNVNAQDENNPVQNSLTTFNIFQMWSKNFGLAQIGKFKGGSD